jgi:Protein of unknown function (DUF3307)
MILLIKLLIAHFIGDFFLQPEKWVKEKEQKKLKSPKLYLHIIIHVLITSLILWNISLWPIVIIIGVSHFIIDATKLLIQKENTKRLLFFIDQLLHVAVIFLCFYLFTETTFNINGLVTESNLLLLVCVLFLTTPTSIIMKTFLNLWDIEALLNKNRSLKNSGTYIGILERLLVFIFIILNQWEAVGFLITAKSVFSFGNLRVSKHRKLTEYILIGTLISFGIAIVTGIIYTIIYAHI